MFGFILGPWPPRQYQVWVPICRMAVNLKQSLISHFQKSCVKFSSPVSCRQKKLWVEWFVTGLVSSIGMLVCLQIVIDSEPVLPITRSLHWGYPGRLLVVFIAPHTGNALISPIICSRTLPPYLMPPVLMHNGLWNCKHIYFPSLICMSHLELSLLFNLPGTSDCYMIIP